jgi:hypothetical protein
MTSWSSEGGILYAVVARGADVMAEDMVPGVRGNFAPITRQLFARMDTDADARTTYELDGLV